MKYTLSFLLVLVLITGSWFGYQHYQDMNQSILALRNEVKNNSINAKHILGLENNIKGLQSDLQQQQEKENIYTIIAGGDIMMDRGVEGRIKKLGEDYNFSFDLIRADLEKADYVFANLEGSISDVGADTGKPYSFRFEPEVAGALAGGSIDGVSLANNHMLDWGRASLCETTKHLDIVGIDYVGGGCNSEIAERPLIKQFGNTFIGFLAYTEFYKGAHAVGETPGMSEYDLEKIAERISDLEKEVDIVIVSMHWGAEYKDRATAAQVSIGQKIIDMGADVIIGHHPHVDQEIERYGDGWIIYSLGNFIFDQSWSKNTMEGILAEIRIQNGKVYDVRPIPIQLNENYQPFIIK
jgi:poly-gamma-glutamate synthesis protein (capsule biosynthesis protein)